MYMVSDCTVPDINLVCVCPHLIMTGAAYSSGYAFPSEASDYITDICTH